MVRGLFELVVTLNGRGLPFYLLVAVLYWSCYSDGSGLFELGGDAERQRTAVLLACGPLGRVCC